MHWFFLLLGLVIALILLIAYITYRMAFYSSPKKRGEVLTLPQDASYSEPVRQYLRELQDDMAAHPYEEVSIHSHDGLILYGRYYHFHDNAPLELQFHGYRGSALRDYCGGNRLAREAGHNALVVDQRAHGKSGGTTICFGIKERLDCQSWVAYAAERFGRETPILLTGVSMGAATVLMASELEFAGNVVGIIADSPFASPESIIGKVCTDMKISPTLAMPFIRLGAKLYGDLDITACSALDAVTRARYPVLIVHGEADDFVPCAMGKAIFDAYANEKTLETFPGAPHGISMLTDPDRYEKIIREFNLRYVPNQKEWEEKR